MDVWRRRGTSHAGVTPDSSGHTGFSLRTKQKSTGGENVEWTCELNSEGNVLYGRSTNNSYTAKDTTQPFSCNVLDYKSKIANMRVKSIQRKMNHD